MQPLSGPKLLTSGKEGCINATRDRLETISDCSSDGSSGRISLGRVWEGALDEVDADWLQNTGDEELDPAGEPTTNQADEMKEAGERGIRAAVGRRERHGEQVSAVSRDHQGPRCWAREKSERNRWPLTRTGLKVSCQSLR